MAADTVVAAEACVAKTTGEANESATATGPSKRAPMRRRLDVEALVTKCMFVLLSDWNGPDWNARRVGLA
jgi:hypothetical protein